MLDMPNQSKLLTFQHFTPQSNTIYLSLVSVLETHIKVDGRRGYFSTSVDSGWDKTYNANQICHMVEFLIYNIFVKFGGHFFIRSFVRDTFSSLEFQWVLTVPPLLPDLFFNSYESGFLDIMIRSGDRKLARSFNLCFRYIDDLTVFNNKKF